MLLTRTSPTQKPIPFSRHRSASTGDNVGESVFSSELSQTHDISFFSRYANYRHIPTKRQETKVSLPREKVSSPSFVPQNDFGWANLWQHRFASGSPREHAAAQIGLEKSDKPPLPNANNSRRMTRELENLTVGSPDSIFWRRRTCRSWKQWDGKGTARSRAWCSIERSC